MENSYTISFIIITWNSEHYLKRCLSSIIEKCNNENISFQIIVTDNGSSDNTKVILDEFYRKNRGVFIVEYLSYNSGTTFSRNIALKKSNSKYICIIDSDTQIRNGNIKSVIDLLDSNGSIGMVVPKLVLPDGAVQNSVKKFPTFIHKIFKIPQAVFKIKTVDRDFYSGFPFSDRTDVDTAISACWFFGSHLLNKVGYLDEKIFYSPEDLDFCVRVKKAGMRIVYDPSFEVFHDTQQISHKKPLSKVSRSHFWGLIYYFKKHGGWISNKYLSR
jgi:GT2 family glycosyltransferase